MDWVIDWVLGSGDLIRSASCARNDDGSGNEGNRIRDAKLREGKTKRAAMSEDCRCEVLSNAGSS